MGVIIGALINTTLSVWNSYAQRKLDSALASRNQKVSQYYESLDTLYTARDALQVFKNANSGLGIIEGKRKSRLPWKNRSYKSHDIAAANAFELLDNAAKDVAIQRARINLVGTPEAAESFAKCYDVISEYLGEVARQVMEDGRFIYSVWEEYWNQYNAQISNTLSIFRQDIDL